MNYICLCCGNSIFNVSTDKEIEKVCGWCQILYLQGDKNKVNEFLKKKIGLSYREEKIEKLSAIKYCLIQDQDGHWFVVPSGKRDEAIKLLDDGLIEDWIEGIDLPKLTFSDYKN